MAFSTLLCVSCGVNNDPGNNPGTEPGGETPPPPPVETVYKNVERAPSYPKISDEIEYTTYYFDSENGDDNNSGLSEGEAKKSLTAANNLISETEATTPVKILFKAGSEWSGRLTLDGFEATEEAPLLIDVYAKTEDDLYAKINGETDDSCVLISSNNVRVSGLECTAPTGYRGIFIQTNKAGALKNVVVSGNYVHDVNFVVGEYVLPEDLTDDTDLRTDVVSDICPDSRYGYANGGIIAETGTSKFVGASWHENLWIENNVIKRVARTGIWIFSSWTYRPGVDWGNNTYHDDDTFYYPHKNVYVCDNYIEKAGGDSIVMGAVRGGYIEGNTSYHAQYLGKAGYYNVGIWPHSCKDVVIQFNEAAYTHKANGCGDGQGFDIDIANQDITFQYNYAHHNDGGGILLCNAHSWITLYDENGKIVRDEDNLPITQKLWTRWQNVAIRNNVFADNTGNAVNLDGYINDLDIDNNTFIFSGTASKTRLFVTGDPQGGGRPGENWRFRNNLFVMRQANVAVFEMTLGVNWSFENNAFYNFQDGFIEEFVYECEAVGTVVLNPGFALTTEAALGYDGCLAFMPTSLEMLQGGVKLDVANLMDMAGKDVKDVHYYGAFGTLAGEL